MAMARMSGEKLEVGFDPSQGVTAPWLAAVFGVSQETVRFRLATCPRQMIKRGWHYELKEAARFLVDHPATSIEQYLEQTSPSDLPLKFQKEYWAMREKRMKVEHTAGELWHSNDVMEAFSDVFQAVKQAVRMWPDTVNREVGLSGAQRGVLLRICDEFQDFIYAEVVKVMADKAAESAVAEFEEMDKLTTSPPEAAEVDEEEMQALLGAG